MTRTSVHLPKPLKSRLARQAREMGVTVDRLIRLSLEQSLSRPVVAAEGTLLDLDVFKGDGPKDVSANVDDYLYGAQRAVH